MRTIPTADVQDDIGRGKLSVTVQYLQSMAKEGGSRAVLLFVVGRKTVKKCTDIRFGAGSGWRGNGRHEGRGVIQRELGRVRRVSRPVHDTAEASSESSPDPTDCAS